MAKRGITVSAEVIQKIQRDFELDNYELAELFGISITSTFDWLKNGVRGERGHNPALVDALLALKWLSEKRSEKFISFGQLKDIIHKVVKTPGFMYLEFLPYEDDLGPAIAVLKHQKLVSAIMAALFVLYLRLEGKEVKLSKFEAERDLRSQA